MNGRQIQLNPSLLRITALVTMAILLLTTLPVTLAHDLGPAGVPVELTWADDEVWEFLVVGRFPIPSNHQSHEPLYAIAPVAGGSHSPQAPAGADPGVGAHDHVIDPPDKTHGRFNANWHVYLVVPGPNAILGGPDANVLFGIFTVDFDGDGVDDIVAPSPYAADLDGDTVIECAPGAGDLSECLTSVDKIWDAIAQGLALTFDTGIEFVCPVRPHLEN